MTDQAVVLRSRQGEVDSTAPAMAGAITGIGGALPEVLQLCNAIAGAGDLIPVHYRNKPGAVLLAKMWGDKHDVDLFTALQQISIIQGKPWVSAEMRVALATAKGFDLRVIESTREVCTIEAWAPAPGMAATISGEMVKRGSVTTHISDIAPRLLKKDNWLNHPDDMLFADVCRKIDRRYVKTAAAMLDSAQDYEVEADVVDTLTATPDGGTIPIGDDEPTETELAADTVDVNETQEEPPPAATPAEEYAIDGAELREIIGTHKSRSVTIPKALRAVQGQYPDINLADLESVAADHQALDWLLAWIGRDGEAGE